MKRIKHRNLPLLVAFFFLLVTFSGCDFFDDDVTFSRRVMTDLIKGHFAVRNSLDWPRLNIMLNNVGAEYSIYKTKDAKLAYERSFISNFARGFNEGKGKLKSFSNWRQEKSADPKLTVVSANYPDKNTTFYFMISRKNLSRKVVAIQIFHKPQPGEKFKEMPKPAEVAPPESSTSGVEQVGQESEPTDKEGEPISP